MSEKNLQWNHRIQMLYDSEVDEYIDPATGEVVGSMSDSYNSLANRDDEIASSPLAEKKLADPDEFCEILIQLACEGSVVTNAQDWVQLKCNPDILIGQTVPYTQHLYEEVKNGSGIRFSMGMAQHSHQVPNCVEIEHSFGKLRTEEDAMINACKEDCHDSDLEFQSPVNPLPQRTEPFEALQLIGLFLKKDPNADWWGWLPTLIHFLAEKVNLVCPNGEISVPDLLSIVAGSATDLANCDEIIRALYAELHRSRTQCKHLRSKLYSKGRKHKNHP